MTETMVQEPVTKVDPMLRDQIASIARRALWQKRAAEQRLLEIGAEELTLSGQAATMQLQVDRLTEEVAAGEERHGKLLHELAVSHSEPEASLGRLAQFANFPGALGAALRELGSQRDALERATRRLSALPGLRAELTRIADGVDALGDSEEQIGAALLAKGQELLPVVLADCRRAVAGFAHQQEVARRARPYDYFVDPNAAARNIVGLIGDQWGQAVQEAVTILARREGIAGI
jgi:tetratricopeptide (TPR) repeat protein